MNDLLKGPNRKYLIIQEEKREYKYWIIHHDPTVQPGSKSFLIWILHQEPPVLRGENCTIQGVMKRNTKICIGIRILQLDKSQSWNNLPIRYMQDDYWSYEAKFCLYYYLVNESLLTFLFCFYDTRQNTTFFEYIILGVFI